MSAMIPVLTAQAIVAKMRLPTPVDPLDVDEIEETILDVQADVEAYLGVPVTPQQFVQRQCYPYSNGWELDKIAEGVPLISVDSAVVEPGGLGLFTVTYTAGYDAREDPSMRPVLRYVRAAVLNDNRMTDMWRKRTGQKGTVTSVSAEGQSTTYKAATFGAAENAKAGSGEPGSLPTLGSLDYWRIAGRRAYQSASRVYDSTP